jgi:transcriptional regulator with XRE-family HTH domain
MELNPDDERMTPRDVLARHVKRLREGANLSLRGLGDELRYGYSYINRVENGSQLPSKGMAKSLGAFFGMGALFTDLLKADHDATIPDYGQALRKEQEALRIQIFNSTVIPGLLQIEEYAREFIRNGRPGTRRNRSNAGSPTGCAASGCSSARCRRSTRWCWTRRCWPGPWAGPGSCASNWTTC